MDYKELLKDQDFSSPQKIADWMHNAKAAIEELLPYQSAIESMGNWGKLFLPYSGCARGCVGRSGVNGIKAEVCMFNPITDVDGGKWRPVNEDALQELLGQFEILQSILQNAPI